MKKTRNLFILTGNSPEVSAVMEELSFKGVVLVKDPLSPINISKIFNNNKSIVCSCEIPSMASFHESPLHIEVVNKTTPTFSNYIDISLGNISKQFENIALQHNCDIGDHKSNSSGIKGAPSVKDCAYCKIISKQNVNNQRILYESNNFIVKNTLGQFINAYLLIIPKPHIMSMAQLNSTLRAEFIEVLNDVSYILKLSYGNSNVLVWENGTGNSGLGKAKDSVVHAHTHVALSNLTANSIQQIAGFSLKQIHINDFPAYDKHSYLLIRGDDNETWWINNNPDLYIPRQFVRQILAEEYYITGEAWNWRKFPYFDMMQKTDKDISVALQNNWDSLPDRIKLNTEKHIFF